MSLVEEQVELNEEENVNVKSENIVKVEEKPVVKKRRGRKPKSETIQKDSKPTPVNPPKKRGRKPRILDANTNSKVKNERTYHLFPDDKFDNDKINYIVHVPIKIDESKTKKETDKSEVIPKPFDNNNDFVSAPVIDTDESIRKQLSSSTLFQEYSTVDNKQIKHINNIMHLRNLQLAQQSQQSQQSQPMIINNFGKQPPITTNRIEQTNLSEIDKNVTFERTTIKKNIIPCLIEFANKADSDEWIKHTNICCTWCCHPFDWTPCPLPKRFNEKIQKYIVEGCFCSFNCSARYCFEEYKSSDKKWEYYSLLNMLYKEVTKSDKIEKIRLAPKRNTLNIFGGSFTIEEFRKKSVSPNYNYDVIFPPMTSLVPVIEENIIKYNKYSDQEVHLDQKLVINAMESLKKSRNRNNKNRLTLRDYAKPMNSEDVITT